MRVIPRRFARRLSLPVIAAVAAMAAGAACTTVNDLTPPSCTYAAVPSAAAFAASGGAGMLTVTASGVCAWSLESDASWLSLSGGAGTGDGRATFVVAANPLPAGRTARITGAGNAITITQAGACISTISPHAASFGAGGGGGSFTVSTSASCAWTATSRDPWVKLKSSGTGTGAGTVEYTVDPNADPASRTGRIGIGDEVLVVSQAGAPPAAPSPDPDPTPPPAPPPSASCTFNVASGTTTFSLVGGSGTATVTTTAGCAWTAVSNDSWISITGGASSTGNGTASFAVSAYLGGPPRTGSLQVAGKAISITQSGVASCSYTLKPTSKTFDDKKHTDHLDVDTTEGCPWTAQTSATWLTIASGSASGSGDGQVEYSMEENTTSADRTATITVAGQTATVTQRKRK
jgi:hypothetical protein